MYPSEICFLFLSKGFNFIYIDSNTIDVLWTVTCSYHFRQPVLCIEVELSLTLLLRM